MNLNDPNLYINRELSQLAFNERILAQALDESIPLLERLKFLFICSSNLDEFFEVRVAGLKQKVLMSSHHMSQDGLTPQESLHQISQRAHQFVSQIYVAFNKKLLPALENQHITFLSPENWNEKLQHWIDDYFNEQVLPILSPIALDFAHPFPRLVNKSLNFIISLQGKDAFNRDSGLAIVHAPRLLLRAIKIPEEFAPKGDHFVLLTHIIQMHIHDLFPGMNVQECHQFRLTRNSDLIVEEEEFEDLAHALQTELLKRHYGHAVRLEIASDCPTNIAHFLLEKHNLEEQDLYYCNGPVNLNRYMAIINQLQRKDLLYPPFTPGIPNAIANSDSIFEAIQEKEILLHHPYDAFSSVVDFIQSAAQDPKVVAIKQTLYRTHSESIVVKALTEAARAGKAVTAVIELLARFDEESNIALANHLQKAGALVVYGVVGYKTHAKMTLILRREANELRRYVHLGTGNYHENTAKQYTDLGLFTSNRAITRDVQLLFQQLTGMGEVRKLKRLLYSPFDLRNKLLALINDETKAAKAGNESKIIAKINGLTDPDVIKALYQASNAGVKIDLIVRGICCLKPGIKGVSENIKVHSIVGRFLEHSRIYYFFHGGKEKVYCASADWMERNLDYRIEIAFPIENSELKQQVISEGLRNYLMDNSKRWILNTNGEYEKALIKHKKKHDAQLFLLALKGVNS